MNPDELFRDMLTALEDRDWRAAREQSNALLAWLDSGGNPPTTVGSLVLGIEWHQTLATFICYSSHRIASSALRKQKRKRSST